MRLPRGGGRRTDCVVHAYDKNLKPLFETGLAEAPELQPLRGRSAIGDGQLKNHIRCVALSLDNQRYLFTAVDEAWCSCDSSHGLPWRAIAASFADLAASRRTPTVMPERVSSRDFVASVYRPPGR